MERPFWQNEAKFSRLNPETSGWSSDSRTLLSSWSARRPNHPRRSASRSAAGRLSQSGASSMSHRTKSASVSILSTRSSGASASLTMNPVDARFSRFWATVNPCASSTPSASSVHSTVEVERCLHPRCCVTGRVGSVVSWLHRQERTRIPTVHCRQGRDPVQTPGSRTNGATPSPQPGTVDQRAATASSVSDLERGGSQSRSDQTR